MNPIESQQQRYAALVVGGGPVGAAMALGLRAQGLRVGLIDQAAPQAVNNPLGVDPRTVALSAASRDLLIGLRSWPDYPVSVIQHMEIWEERGTAMLEFEAPVDLAIPQAADAPPARLGYLAEIAPWREFLWRQLEQAGVDLHVGVVQGLTRKAQGIEEGDTGAQAPWVIETSQGQFETPLVIAADGANSIVRRSLDLAMPLVPTGQSALATAAETSLAHNRTAYQRFLTTGPVALLPLQDEHLVSVVWSADDALADELAALRPEALALRLGQATQERLGPIKRLLPAVRFPLRQGVVRDFVPAPGVVLIGDAARVIHPLAGQGINLGFEDVSGVLQCIAGELTWPRFARRRRARSLLAIQLMSSLNAAYGGSRPGIQWARNQVVRGLNRNDALKRLLIREAMGLGPLAQAG